jgi:hypothetical protein
MVPYLTNLDMERVYDKKYADSLRRKQESILAMNADGSLVNDLELDQTVWSYVAPYYDGVMQFAQAASRMLEDKPGMNPADLTGKLLYKQLVSGKPNFAGLQVLHPCLPRLDIRPCSALPCRRAVVCVRPWSWPIDAFGGSQGRVVVDGFGVREGHFCLKSIVGRQYVKVRPLRHIVTCALRCLCHFVFRPETVRVCSDCIDGHVHEGAHFFRK